MRSSRHAMPVSAGLSATPGTTKPWRTRPGTMMSTSSRTSINICDQANIENVLPPARKNNVGVLAKRPIANAAWTEPSARRGIYIDYAKPYSLRLAGMGISPEDLGYFGDSGAAWSEIALRFTLAQAGVSTAIVGTTKPANVQRNLEIAAKGPLSEDAVANCARRFSVPRPTPEKLGRQTPSFRKPCSNVVPADTGT